MAIKTLSIPRDMEVFLDENPDLSPSKMLQSKIIEIRESKKINHMELERLKNINKKFQSLLLEANDKIDMLEKNNGR